VNIMFNNESFDESMFMDIPVLETIDEIAADLFEIEESVMLESGIIMPGDWVLQECKFPTVSALLHISCEA
jgi:hypothetical protein